MTPEEELDRLMEIIDHYEHFATDEFDQNEYERVMARYENLRRAGYGPQPHHLDD